MSIAQSIEISIKNIPEGQIFGYQELPIYAKSPVSVIRVISKLVEEKRIERFSKGKFYVSKKGIFSSRKPSDNELIRSFLLKNGKLRGYITGLALFNQLGLTTQIPKTVTVSINGGRQTKDFGTIRIKAVVSRAPIKEKDVKLLQYLDVLKDIKKITDSDINSSLKIIQAYIEKLSVKEKNRFLRLAEDYYTPQVKALAGLLFDTLGLSVNPSFRRSINPTTTFRLNLNSNKWPQSKEWNIQ